MIGIGERVEVEVDLADGVFPLVTVAEGKPGQALTLVRTATGTAPDAAVRPDVLNRRIVTVGELRAAEAVRLPARRIDRSHDLVLSGGIMPYRWTINGRTFDDSKPLLIGHGERVRLRIVNRTEMFHPTHVHGHTFQVASGGPREDTSSSNHSRRSSSISIP